MLEAVKLAESHLAAFFILLNSPKDAERKDENQCDSKKDEIGVFHRNKVGEWLHSPDVSVGNVRTFRVRLG